MGGLLSQPEQRASPSRGQILEEVANTSQSESEEDLDGHKSVTSCTQVAAGYRGDLTWLERKAVSQATLQRYTSRVKEFTAWNRE
eukprot:4150206-Amphidinium_carterae.1